MNQAIIYECRLHKLCLVVAQDLVSDEFEEDLSASEFTDELFAHMEILASLSCTEHSQLEALVADACHTTHLASQHALLRILPKVDNPSAAFPSIQKW